MSTHFVLLELYVNANCTTTCSRSGDGGEADAKGLAKGHWEGEC